jgi:RNA polymerase sigma factor (sigma-70 family)
MMDAERFEEHGADWHPPEEEGTAEFVAVEFGAGDSQAIEVHARRQRMLDRALAEELEEAKPDIAPVTTTYLRELDRRPRLPRALEQQLIAAAQAGDPEARAQLIERFLPLIASVARLYRSSPRIEWVELLQEGVVGLLRALERYEPERGVPFWGYAAWWVRQAMQQLVAELTRPVVLSDRALRQLARMKDVHRSYVQAQGREPTHRELAAGADLTTDQVANLIASDQPARALDEPVHGEDGNLGTFGELLVDPIAEDEYERALDEIEVQQLRSLLSGLSDRERAILRDRYGLQGDEQTLAEIAGRLGLSAERVRQIEQRALAKLRGAVAPEMPAERRPNE